MFEPNWAAFYSNLEMKTDLPVIVMIQFQKIFEKKTDP